MPNSTSSDRSFKLFFQSLLKQNYHVTHSYHRLRLWAADLTKKEKIVVYQMGKVGSTTIWKSLEASRFDAPIFHVHTLNSKKIARSLEADRVNFPKRRFIYYEVVQEEHLRRQLDRKHGQTLWNVITLVRDPIAITLSSFFQKLEVEIPLGLDYREKMKTEGRDSVLKEIRERFYEECVYNSDWEHPFEWFNHELRDNFNVDIFEGSPLEKKDYFIYRAVATNVLLLKLESLNNCYQNAFRAFLGLQNFELVPSNIGLQKRYKTLYKAFLKEVNLPSDYIDRVYTSPLVKHLYSESEIEKFYQRWQS